MLSWSKCKYIRAFWMNSYVLQNTCIWKYFYSRSECKVQDPKSLSNSYVSLRFIAPDKTLSFFQPKVTEVILKGDLGEKVSLSWLTSLSGAEEEVKMYSMYREIQNLDQNFSLKSWNCRKTSPYLKVLGWALSIDIFLFISLLRHF